MRDQVSGNTIPMGDLGLPLPRLLSAAIADVTRWYWLTGSWYKALATAIVGMLLYLDTWR